MKLFFKSETCGVICALLLIILLCESKFFNFLIDTCLGKILLIASIIYLSYLNKILGIVVILFIIIIFNNNISFTEGMANNSNSNDIKSNNNNINSNDNKSNNNNINSNDNKSNNNKSNDNKKKPIVNNKDNSIETTNTIEGFDIIGAENSIKRGKDSNSIPVDPFMGVSNSVLPFEGSNLVESFSAF